MKRTWPRVTGGKQRPWRWRCKGQQRRGEIKGEIVQRWHLSQEEAGGGGGPCGEEREVRVEREAEGDEGGGGEGILQRLEDALRPRRVGVGG